VVVDFVALLVSKRGTARQDHPVSIVVDHVRSRAHDAGADECLAVVGQAGRGKLVAEEEGIEAIKATQLIECNLATRSESQLGTCPTAVV
jgi:hypothetical protein